MEKMIKFVDFLESRINIFSSNTKSVIEQIVQKIVKIFTLKTFNHALDELVKGAEDCGVYHLWGQDFQVFFGKPLKQDDSYIDLSNNIIYIKYRGREKFGDFYEEILHELTHLHDFANKYYNSSREIPGERDKLKREFDAFTTQIGQHIAMSQQTEKEQPKQWIERGFNLHEPNLPPIINQWQNHLLSLNPYFIKKFQSRIKNYVLNDIKKEI